MEREIAAFAGGAPDPRLMVKPAGLGSSVGMTLVHAPTELPAAIDLALRYDTVALVETYVPGARDLEVSVIGNDHAHLEIFGPGEIVSGHEFYDYAAKYTPGLSETSTRAEVDDRAAGRSSTSCRATCIARSAPRASPGSTSCVSGDRIVVSEINTIPGFTPISLFPTMPSEGGYSFTDVCIRIVELGLERFAARPATHLQPGDLPR